jgi:hypothetical protein
MDSTFVTGAAATISALLVFCGSVWLVLTMVLGARLAYFVTASVTFAFTLILGLVWGFTNPGSPLGPVGETPSWSGTAIGENVSEFGFPEGEWRVPNEDDDAEAAIRSDFEGDAADYLETAIGEGEGEIGLEAADDAAVDTESTRLIEVDGTTYGGTVFEPLQGVEAEPVVIVMEYDPGNPLAAGRQVAIGSLVLLVLHLFGLSRAERKAKQLPGAEVA